MTLLEDDLLNGCGQQRAQQCSHTWHSRDLEVQEDEAHGDPSLWSRAPAIKLGRVLVLRKALVIRTHKNFGIFTHLVNQGIV